MDDAMKRALLGDILDRVGSGGIGQVVMEQNNTITVGQPMPVQMPPHLTREQGMALYTFLISNNYIDAVTPSEDFLYLMGISSMPPVKMKLINWLNTVQQLRKMLTLVFDEPLKRGSLKLAEIERRAPLCFLNKGKKMSVLAKPSAEYSAELDAIENFFRPKSN